MVTLPMPAPRGEPCPTKSSGCWWTERWPCSGAQPGRTWKPQRFCWRSPACFGCRMTGGWKPKKVTQSEVDRALRGKMHYHVCIRCGGIYWDHCKKVESHGTCPCRTVHGRPVWLTDHDPAPCCAENVELMTLDRIKSYRLAGPGPWFQCKTCRRFFGHRPVTTPVGA